MRLGVDIGGTFTDVVAYDERRDMISVSKVLNDGTGPEVGVRNALAAVGIQQQDVREFTHGTTVVTNLLIERNGATVGLICSRGFRDCARDSTVFARAHVRPGATSRRPPWSRGHCASKSPAASTAVGEGTGTTRYP